MNRTKFLVLASATAMIVSTAQAQNIYADIATGMAEQGIAEAEKLLEAAPGLLDETLRRGEVGEEFETAQYCRGALQSAINLGAAVSNIMPFSEVWTLEDQRGPVGRFRIMLNGEQIHTDVYCEGSLLRSVLLPWGPGSSDPDPVQITTFSAIAGAALNLKLQGAFDDPEVDAAAAPNADTSQTTDTSSDMDSAQNADTTFDVASSAALASTIQRCWNVGSLSAEALQVNIRVSVSLEENGMPDVNSITMLSHNGTSEAAARQAYEAARRAIIRCGANGFELPPDQYEQWETLTLEFDPTQMRIQ
ncbi:hypothetical protein [Pontivivens nitratireducens]|uniref:hypothetical protein n=1 Tax=Pontivivens nitratireducens TaxID=2758038 RepID=UPI00163A8103|nr:hypothetical protein [Pontibrevibacter nitratireducens]